MTDLLQGNQEPRIKSVPPYKSSTGQEAVELAAMAGLHLDPWQQQVLIDSLAERPDGLWASMQVGLCVARQNGKDAILEARELAGLFLLGERLIIHTAHLFDTSLTHYRRLRDRVQSTPELDKLVKRRGKVASGYINAHGDEGIELKDGRRIHFRTRTKSGGRGFTGDLLIFNEAMILPEEVTGSILPTLSARPNPQVWYTGSAVDQLVHEHGIEFARIREGGIRGDEGLAYFEWSAVELDEHGKEKTPDRVSASVLVDRKAWAQANPALGYRMNEEWIEKVELPKGLRQFAVERLGIGDWPATDGSGDRVLDLGKWGALVDRESQVKDPVCFAFEVSPDRTYASIGVAGARPDKLPHIEVVERRAGTGWVAARAKELKKAHKNIGFYCSGSSPAGSLIPEFEKLGLKVETLTEQEHAKACGVLFDLVEQQGLRHRGQHQLDDAVKGATSRPMGDSWAFSRLNSNTDVSALIACTLALWVWQQKRKGAPLIAYK